MLTRIIRVDLLRNCLEAGRGARGEREDIPSGHPLASNPVPLA